MLVKEDVNKVNTPTWVRVNEDAQKQIYRKMFIEQFGGKFSQNGRMLKWQPIEITTDKYVVLNPEEKIELVEVFSKFCRERQLNKAAMYGTLRGDRKQHKGYKLIKIPD